MTYRAPSPEEEEGKGRGREGEGEKGGREEGMGEQERGRRVSVVNECTSSK